MTTGEMICPKCGHAQPEGFEECRACGVIFAKIRPSRRRPTAADRFEPEFDRFLLEPRGLSIEQHARHWWEILTDYEQRNEYTVSTSTGQIVGWIVEQGRGLGDAILRIVAGSHRPFEVAVVSTEGQPILELGRKFFLLFSDMEVRGPAGRLMGRVKRRFAILRRNYDLEDAHGRVFARISSPLFKIWTFPVIDETGNQAAVISKKWSGLAKEWWTDADNFGVDFGTREWTPEQRAVIFAAATSVDFDFFENNRQS